MPDKHHFLVTAGGTRETIDQVRTWGNVFTGQTGLDIALALLDLGDVTLLTSTAAHASEYDGYYGRMGMLGIETFTSHADLRELLEERVPGQPIAGVFMTAAVSDYAPTGVFAVENVQSLPDGTQQWTVRNVQQPKVPSTYEQIAVLGARTDKLVDLFRTAWHYTGLLVKFKLQVGITDDQLLAIAEKSRQTSNADYIVANTLDMVRGTRPGAYILGRGVQERVDRHALAARLRDLAQRHLTASS